MYNAMVQQLLDSIGGYGSQSGGARQQTGAGQMLRDNLWGNALSQASGGILGKPNANVPSPTQTASIPTTASTPTISDDDLDSLINSVFGGGGGGGGSITPVRPSAPSGGTSGGGGSSSTTIASGGSSSGSQGTGISGGGHGTTITSRQLDREGGAGPGTKALASGGQTNVVPGGGLISYGTTPQKKTQGYWWESEPWYQG